MKQKNQGLLFSLLLLLKNSSLSGALSSSSLEEKEHSSFPLFLTTSSSTSSSHNNIKVLPPIPDDDEHEICNSTVPCGKERYCTSVIIAAIALDDIIVEEQEPEDDTFSQDEKKQNICLHKSFWLPISIYDYLGMISIGICAFIAAMGGIGGGGLILPILIIITNFTTKEASIISNSCVFGNGLSQFIINNFIKPKDTASSSKSSSHIVSGTVLMILPGLLVGGSIAIIVEKYIPSLLILILAFCTLVFATIKTYYKAKKISLLDVAKAKYESRSTSMHQSSSFEGGAGCEENLLTMIDDVYDDINHNNSFIEGNGGDVGAAITIGDNDNSTGTEHTGHDDDERSHITPITTNESLFFSNENSRIEYQRFYSSTMNVSSTENNNDSGEDSDDKVKQQEQDEEPTGSQQDVEVITNFVRLDDDDVNTDNDNDNISNVFKYCWCKYSIEILVILCWLCDAITFLALKGSGFFDFIHKETTLWYIVLIMPAFIGIIFVLLGRKQLRRDRNCSSNSTSGDDDNNNFHDTMSPPLSSSRTGSPVLSTPSSMLPTEAEEQRRQREYQQQFSSGIGDSTPVEISPIKRIIDGSSKHHNHHDDTFEDEHTLQEGKVQDGSNNISNNNNIINIPKVQLDNTTAALEGESNNNRTTAPGVPGSGSGGNEFNNLVWWLPLISIIIGFLSALLGIGGGELLGPVLLIINMNPIYSSTTTATLSLLNAFTNVIHYTLDGYIFGFSTSYNIIFSFMGFLGGFVGRYYTTIIMKSATTKTTTSTPQAITSTSTSSCTTCATISTKKQPSSSEVVIAYSLFIVLFIATLLITYELIETIL